MSWIPAGRAGSDGVRNSKDLHGLPRSEERHRGMTVSTCVQQDRGTAKHSQPHKQRGPIKQHRETTGEERSRNSLEA